MKPSDAVSALKALAQDSRLAAYRLLVQAGPQGLAVGEIGERLKLPGATLTNHLNVLRRARLVRDVREGRSIRCRADYPRMHALLAFLTDNCCGSDVTSCAPVCTPAPKRKLAR
jgi:ArsR family transcriptional regulator, arsenate/arsenite/antimonite-responsive transcriptional repressor